jgi:hypothetical protein
MVVPQVAGSGGLGSLQLVSKVVDGGTHSVSVGVKDPVMDANSLMALFQSMSPERQLAFITGASPAVDANKEH